MITTACAFTGHRPQRFSFGFDEEAEKCIQLKQKLMEQITKMVDLGVKTFYTGMALGVDQWAAEIVIELKRKQHPHICLIAVVPCESQADRWSAQSRGRYFDTLLPACDDVVTLQRKYTPDCMQKRNRWMVDHAGHLLAVYDSSERGGTFFTVKYARQKGLYILSIHPDTLEVFTNADYDAIERRKQIRIIK